MPALAAPPLPLAAADREVLTMRDLMLHLAETEQRAIDEHRRD